MLKALRHEKIQISNLESRLQANVDNMGIMTSKLKTTDLSESLVDDNTIKIEDRNNFSGNQGKEGRATTTLFWTSINKESHKNDGKNIICSRDRRKEDMNTAEKLQSTQALEQNESKTQCESLEDRLHQAIESRKEVQKELRSCKVEKDKLTKDLEACKAELCKVAPTDLITDSDIRNEYLDLNRQISHWISNALRRFDEKRHNKEDTSFLGNADGSDDFTLALCASIESAPEFLLHSIISKYIYEKIGSKDRFLTRLPRRYEEVLEDVESGLLQIAPGRGLCRVFHSGNDLLMIADESAVCRWRWETLNALSASLDYENFFPKLSNSLAQKLEGNLKARISGLRRIGSLRKELPDDILLPAIQLEHRIRLSKTEYATPAAFAPEGQFVQMPVKREFLHEYKAIDLETRRSVMDAAALRTDNSGNVAYGGITFAPGLVRKRGTDDEFIFLEKPSAAFRLIAPAPKRARTSRQGRT